MAAPLIHTYLLRDTRHGGPASQPTTVAATFAAFVGAATASIDCAIYDFRLNAQQLAGPVITALSSAADRGVSVRIAYDAGKPVPATAATFARLAADPAPPGTAAWVSQHFAGTKVQTKAITAASGQLMHSKYLVRDGALTGHTAAVWTGSTNFTDDAWTLQENNIITVSSAAVAAAYRLDFEALWSAGAIKATGAGDSGSSRVGQASVGWDFAPGDGKAIDAALVAAVSAATERIAIASMVLTSRTVLSALVAALDRGVPVSGIYDSGQMGPIEREWAGNANSAAVLADWNKLKAVLAHKRSAPYTEDGPHDFMHNKILIADAMLVTGSYNFSANAEKNAENQLQVSRNPALVTRYADYIATIVAVYSR
ncbi:MAG: phospholipase D-like domain-containing protein [Jatrophihabitans sp.]